MAHALVGDPDGHAATTKDAHDAMRHRTITYGTLALALTCALVPLPAFAAPTPPSAITVPLDPRTTEFRAELERRQQRVEAFRAQLDEQFPVSQRPAFDARAGCRLWQ